MKTKTRWASYILALVLALSFGSLTVAAQEKTTGGKAVTVTGCLQKGDEAGEYSITSEDGKRYGLRSKTVYRTTEFYPHRYASAFTAKQHIYHPKISRRDNFLILVANQRETLDWTDSRDIEADTWDLYIGYFDANRNLLYLPSSRKGNATGALAAAISKDPVLISDEETFKAFSGLKRLTLYSVGLSSRSKNVRYQLFAGLDVRNAIDPIQQQDKMKSNITGLGYENGKRKTVGCSRKGKIWSTSSGSIADWKSWCDEVGTKLRDPNAQPQRFP